MNGVVVFKMDWFSKQLNLVIIVMLMECLSTAVRNKGDDAGYRQCCHVTYGSPIGPSKCCTEYDFCFQKKKSLGVHLQFHRKLFTVHEADDPVFFPVLVIPFSDNPFAI